MKNRIAFARGLDLPPDAVTQTFAFLARRGAGKTYAASKLVEGMLDIGAQVVILDPVGNWSGLRLAADGKSPGIAIPVFGGQSGDVPLEATGGELVANLVVDREISVVLDVSGFRKGARKEFVTAFAEQLFHRKKSSRSAIHVVFEEAQLFVPQKAMHGEERLLGAMEDLVKLGRNYGIGASLISQRPQSVNKDVLNQTEILVALQTTGPQERKTIEGWIVEHGMDTGTALRDLPSLPVGEAFVWSPQWLGTFKRVKIERKRTFDGSSTPTVGAQTTRVRRLAPVDLAQIHEAMKDTIQRAAHNDPKALRAHVAELEALLRDAHKTRPISVQAPKIPFRVPRDTEASVARIRKAAEQIVYECERNAQSIRQAAAQIRDEAERALAPLVEMANRPDFQPAYIAVRRESAPGAATAREVMSARSKPPAKDKDAAESSIGNSGMRRMLVALAQNRGGLTATKLSILTGISQSGGTWRTYLGKLRSSGYVEGPNNGMVITSDGERALGDYDPLPSGQALIEYWRTRLGNSGKRRIFDVLVDAYPRALDHESVSTKTGIDLNGGTWRTYVGELRGLELIEGRGELRASKDLFE